MFAIRSIYIIHTNIYIYIYIYIYLIEIDISNNLKIIHISYSNTTDYHTHETTILSIIHMIFSLI